jgi:hypothetical protein
VSSPKKKVPSYLKRLTLHKTFPVGLSLSSSQESWEFSVPQTICMWIDPSVHLELFFVSEQPLAEKEFVSIQPPTYRSCEFKTTCTLPQLQCLQTLDVVWKYFQVAVDTQLAGGVRYIRFQ